MLVSATVFHNKTIINIHQYNTYFSHINNNMDIICGKGDIYFVSWKFLGRFYYYFVMDLPPSSAEVKNAWSYTSTYLHGMVLS